MFVWVLYLVFALSTTQCVFLFCNHLNEEEKARCFILIVVLITFDCCCSVIFLTVPLVGLQCVIVVIPAYIHLLFFIKLSSGSIYY